LISKREGHFFPKGPEEEGNNGGTQGGRKWGNGKDEKNVSFQKKKFWESYQEETTQPTEGRTH